MGVSPPAQLDESLIATRGGLFLKRNRPTQAQISGGGFAFAVRETHCAPQKCDRFWEERASLVLSRQRRDVQREAGTL